MRILGRHGHLLERVVADVHERDRPRVAPARPRGPVRLDRDGGLRRRRSRARGAGIARRVGATRPPKRFFAGGYRHVHPLWPLAALNNVAAGQISIDLDLRGDNFVLSSQADGGVRALLEAMHALRDGATDAALAGGVAEPIGPASLARLGLRGVLGDGAAAPLCAEGGRDLAGRGRRRVPAPARGRAGRGAAAGLPARRRHHVGPRARTAPGRPRTPSAARSDRPSRRRVSTGATSTPSSSRAEGRAAQDAAELAAVRDVCGAGPRLVATQGAIGHTGSGAPALNVALALRALRRGRRAADGDPRAAAPAAAGRVGRVRGPAAAHARARGGARRRRGRAGRWRRHGEVPAVRPRDDSWSRAAGSRA